jgi:hypothetical protein
LASQDSFQLQSRNAFSESQINGYSYQQAQPSWLAGVELIFTSITVRNS